MSGALEFRIGDRVVVPPRTFTGTPAPGGSGRIIGIERLPNGVVDLDVRLDSGERRTPPAHLVERESEARP